MRVTVLSGSLWAIVTGSAFAAADISGTWVARLENSRAGEMEFVYELKVDANGKIKGTQKLPFGDWPIVDGKMSGNSFTLTVATEFFGRIENQVVQGTVEGDTLRIMPAMPTPPPNSMPGFSPPGATGQPPPSAGPRTGDLVTGGPPGFMGISGPLVFRRGTPSPSYRAPSVDYSAVRKVELPARRDLEPNGMAQTPPMGWNSWNKFHTRISDKTVREIADAMVSSGMKAAGYQYVNIDDGWQWKRDENGNLLPNPGFPDMKALVDYIHSKGLKLGIYSSPGPRTCGGFEGSYGHEDQDAQVWAAWGIDYLKYDWCSASRIWKDEDIVGLVNSRWAKMATRSPIYPGIRLRERRASTRCRTEDMDRLLEDQFDSHLSPLRTGTG